MDNSLTRTIPRSVRWGWGDPDYDRSLPDSTWKALEKKLGTGKPSSPATPVPLSEMELRDSRLNDEARKALISAVGEGNVRDDRETRVEHAGGKSYPDVYRRFHGDARNAPDAVVFPREADAVQRLLATCEEHDIAVVPFGGGTSVVGGVEPLDGGKSAVIAIDLRHLNRMLSCDQVSQVATLQAGMRGPEYEAALQGQGLTLGHFPQSHQEATIGGYIATRSAGQASTGYGRPDDHLIGARVATPAGELALGHRAPASAAGPRLLEMVAGSEGTLGILTEVTVTVRPVPEAKAYGAWMFPSFQQGMSALREMHQSLPEGAIAEVCRLSDEEETNVNMTLAGSMGSSLLKYAAVRGLKTPSILICVWEGATAREVNYRKRLCTKVIRAHEAIALPEKVAKSWEHGRFNGPYLRDSLIPARVFVETLETATTWSNATRLHDAVHDAIKSSLAGSGGKAAVMCHVSHVYRSGCSLYFMFAAPETEDPLQQWQDVKDAASHAIVSNGGTITHHHAVGKDHRPFVHHEFGDVGARMLGALKRELDPHGILNPEKTLPAPGESES